MALPAEHDGGSETQPSPSGGFADDLIRGGHARRASEMPRVEASGSVGADDAPSVGGRGAPAPHVTVDRVIVNSDGVASALDVDGTVIESDTLSARFGRPDPGDSAQGWQGDGELERRPPDEAQSSRPE